MKGYVVTLRNLPESVKIAERCVASGAMFGVDVEMFSAVYKDVAMDEMKKEGIVAAAFDKSFSIEAAVMGNFVTQYRIWKTILNSNECGIVLEHDAIFTDHVPALSGEGDIINLGKPSYGQFNVKPGKGVYPMFSKNGGYIPGAHCYYLTPAGAEQLITITKIKGAAPCDLFLNKANFPNIKEIYPWCAEADDSFTTIQKEKGCGAKHNYGSNYRII